MNENQDATKVIVHDRNGTWCAPGGLHVLLLTSSATRQLKSGDTTVLDKLEGVPLDVLLAEVDDDPTIEWR
jgi:hypothetical protein